MAMKQREKVGRTPEEIEEESRVDLVLVAKQKLEREIDESSLDELRKRELRRRMDTPPPRILVIDQDAFLDIVTGEGVK